MRQVLIGIVLFTLFTLFQVRQLRAESVPTTVKLPQPTVEYTLPYPGILPDHSLYFLKSLRNKILLFLTKEPVKKSQLYLLLSDKSFVMGQLLWEKKRFDLAKTSLEEGETQLLKAIGVLLAQKRVAVLPPGLADKIELSAKKHQELLKKLIDQTTDEENREKLSGVIAVNNQAMQQVLLLK